MAFSMHDHAGCKLASDWLLIPSLARKFEPFFHLRLTLGRGNTSRTNFIYFYFFFVYFWLLLLKYFMILVLFNH